LVECGTVSLFSAI